MGAPPRTPTRVPLDAALGLLDRLARLDRARRDLHLELDRHLDGQPAEVSRAYWRLLRSLDEAGLRLIEHPDTEWID